MSKVAHYLQEHLLGEVMTSADARRHFATDNSIFTLAPSIVVYPRNENDVRKTARFAWQLAERGRMIPITARGSGTDMTGAAIGNGIIMAFPAHMNRIVELDSKSGIITMEPGLNYGRAQQTLHTHERFLPAYPASIEYSTIGGAVANNAAGHKSIKYGVTGDYVKSLRVVLANGEVIETKRLHKREFNKKLGLTTFEGEIYRSVDKLIEEHKEVIEKGYPSVAYNTAGYNLAGIKLKDGSFDLTPLFVGSQGTLGIVTEITSETEAYNPETIVFAAFFDEVQKACDASKKLRDLAQRPSAIEFVDGNLLRKVQELNPNQLKEVLPGTMPGAALIIEVDDPADRQRKKTLKHIRKILEEYSVETKEESDPHEIGKLWKIRHATATLLSHSNKEVKPLPLIEDAIVPVDKLYELITATYALCKTLQLEVALWGPIGEGNLHLYPFLNLSEIGDRQKAFKLMDEYYSLVTKLGGSISAQHNDGRLRGPYLSTLYSPEVIAIFEALKKIFDPYEIMNPGVKVSATKENVRSLLRNSYSLGHLYNHMPRS